MSRLRGWLGVAVSLLLLGLALSVLYHLDHEYRWRDVVTHVREVPGSLLFNALIFTFLNYVLLTGYDWMAIRQVGAKVPYQKVALTSFIGYTFSNTLGFSLLTGASVRYRFYTAAGLSPSQIARVIVYCSVTFFLGLVSGWWCGVIAGREDAAGGVADPVVAGIIVTGHWWRLCCDGGGLSAIGSLSL
jgi:Predicted integral membrane protein